MKNECMANTKDRILEMFPVVLFRCVSERPKYKLLKGVPIITPSLQ